MRALLGHWIVMVLLACFCAAGVAEPAGASSGIDRSFGGNGVIDLPGSPSRMAVGPGGEIYLLRSLWRCQSTCTYDLYLTRRRANGWPDQTYAGGEDGLLVLQGLAVGYGPGGPSLAIDSRGRALVSGVQPHAIVLARLLPDGSLDPSFGQGGRQSIPCDCTRLGLASRPVRGGGIFLWGGGPEPLPEYPSDEPFRERIALARLTEDGAVDQSFGGLGWTGATLEEAYGPQAFASRANGTTFLGGTYGCCGPAGIYLLRFRPDGSFDNAFAARVSRSLRRLKATNERNLGDIAAIVPLRRGLVELIGATQGRGYVLRLRRDGSLERRFGHLGMKLLKWRVWRIAPLGGGRLFAVGDDVEEEGALAFVLKTNGSIPSAFGRGHKAIALRVWDPFQVTIGMQQGPRPVLFETGVQYCRYYCPSKPKLLRFRPIGK